MDYLEQLYYTLEYHLVELYGNLFLISLTGTLVMGIWYLIGRILDKKGYFYFLYQLLRILPVFFILPIVPMSLKLPYFQEQSDVGYLFWATPTIHLVVKTSSIIWIVGFIGVLGYYLFLEIRQIRRNRERFTCPKMVQNIYEEVGQELQLKKKPKIYHTYATQVPMVFGIFRPVIYLPVETFEKEELQVIFIHELNHYRQKDILLKWISIAIEAVQWFNPAVWIFHQMICRWSEYSCDWLSCKSSLGIKQYFQIIFKMAQKKSGLKDCVKSGLFEDSNELCRRIKKMKKSQKSKQKTMKTVGILLVFLLIVSLGTVYAATETVIKSYKNLYNLTEEGMEVLLDKVIEDTEVGFSKNLTIETGETIQNDKSDSIKFDWTVLPKNVKETKEVYLVKGTKVTISVMPDSDDNYIRVGIVQSGGRKQYMSIKDAYTKELLVNTSARYSIFAENQSDSTINVFGKYVIQ